MTTHRIDISYKSVIFITAFLIGLWIVGQILDVILLFFVAFIFMSAFYPLADRLVSWKIPRTLAVLLILLLTIASIAGLLAFGLTPLIMQTISMSHQLSITLTSLFNAVGISQASIGQELSNFSSEAVNITVNIFKNIVSLVSILVVSVYLLLDRAKIEDYGTSFFGVRQERAKKTLRSIEDKLGAWLRGQILLSLLIGILVYIGLSILGIEAALPLAIIAAFLEVIPVIGPIIAAIPAVLIALTISPVLAGIVAGLYLVIQQFENHVVVPQVMKKAVGLNPLLVILAISIGGRLLGIGGALLAVPIAAVIQIVLQEVLKVENPVSNLK
ncbi:MAG: AI-2E family transporter [Candidatus Daviesbacteria bacterium]|nr:AI-2E family transporter [Candidatus Daviesbacteria bacterium]